MTSFTVSPYLMRNPRDWNEARRDELARTYQMLEAAMKTLEGDERLYLAKLNIDDAMGDIRGAIERLTDDIGDEIDWKGLGAAS